MNIIRALIPLVVMFVCFSVSTAADLPSQRKARPNIVIVLADDVGFSDIGCYGGEIHTPNLDALATGGVRFTQFYNVSRCCPSRACLLTGLYPHQTGVGDMTQNLGNPTVSDGYAGDLNQHCVTIAQVLKSAGYGTYAVGKWHVTREVAPDATDKHNLPTHRGFDRYYGTIIGAGSFFDPGLLCRDDKAISPFTDPEYRPPAGSPYYYTDAIGDQACRFIREHQERHADQPFFLYTAFTAAHWPMQALPEDIARYKGVYDVGYEPIRRRFEREKKLGLIDASWEISPQFGNWDKVKDKTWEARCMEVYAAMLDRMDQNIGRIVQTLRDQHQIDNTLILYLQDNGGNWERQGRDPKQNPERAEHPTLTPLAPDHIQTEMRPRQTRDGWPVLDGRNVLPGPADTYIAYGQAWGNVSNTPFREYKHWVHEGGISTPLIAFWPAGITRHGELEKQPGHLIDLMATCAELGHAIYPRELRGQDIYPTEGVSLLPAFAGTALTERSIFWEHEGNRAMRQGQWKLVAKGAAGKWELYDLAKDRTEMHDLAVEEAPRLESMARDWENWAKRCHVLPWPWKPAYDRKGTSNDRN